MGKKDNKRKAKNEFRYNTKTLHKDYIFEETKNRYHSVGITHHEETFGKKNMPLSQNPQKEKSEKAYVRNGINSQRKKTYSKKTIKNLEFEKSDFAKVKSKIRNYKNSRRKPNKKGK